MLLLTLLTLLGCTGSGKVPGTHDDSGSPGDGGTTGDGGWPTDPLAGVTRMDGCRRPPDTLIAAAAEGLRFAVVGDWPEITTDSKAAPVQLELDLSKGAALLERLGPDTPWEVGCGSIEEWAPLPDPTNEVLESSAGGATLLLAPAHSQGLFWEGSIDFHGLELRDAEGAIVLELDDVLDLRFLTEPPA